MTFLDILAQLAQGVSYTVVVTLVCSSTGLLVGLTLASLRHLQYKWVVPWIDFYTYVFRGVPVLVLLFMVYFGLPSIGFKVPPLMAMALSLGLVASAYLAEVFRGAFNSIDKNEVLAAEAMGMSRIQVLWYIELPQMLRFSVPGMVNEFTSVLKYSPFAYTVGIPEITKQAMTLTATTLRGVEIYLAVGVLYFMIYRVCLFGVQLLSKRYQIPGIQPA
ncbi:amino acid ABC transporter permease [Polynucleobacter antarcticus]|uniref:Amino acid ABC transporter ATP-binding protein n=1 Tax=Polynucleobacter antarcticus TaxID=1743162 RepID=A0A6M9PS77_9BURK|nr:amino acid ABC transporter permease [Polynucleobacter antarcticus]QKM62348.1 amino acid ABC transporter ATP-binding protein [Polynucleobacter antarcticus]